MTQNNANKNPAPEQALLPEPRTLNIKHTGEQKSISIQFLIY